MRGTGTKADPWILRTWEDFETVIEQEGCHARFAPNTVIDMNNVAPEGLRRTYNIRCSVDGNNVLIKNLVDEISLFNFDFTLIFDRKIMYFKNFFFENLVVDGYMFMLDVKPGSHNYPSIFVFQRIYADLHTTMSPIYSSWDSISPADGIDLWRTFFACTFDLTYFGNKTRSLLALQNVCRGSNVGMCGPSFHNCLFNITPESLPLTSVISCITDNHTGSYNGDDLSRYAAFSFCLLTSDVPCGEVKYSVWSDSIFDAPISGTFCPVDSRAYVYAEGTFVNIDKHPDLWSDFWLKKATTAQLSDTAYLASNGFIIGPQEGAE